MRNKNMQQLSALCTTRACLLFLALLCGLAVQAQVGGAAGASRRKENADKAHLIELHENNWELMLQGEWMVEFFAPWCPACKSLAPTWEKFAANARDANVNVAKIDVTTSPSLSGRFFVTALPTIYHVKDGEFRQYRGSRDGDAFMFFVKQKQWDKIEPVSAWKKPNTIHMSVLSYFFKLSHVMKTFKKSFKDFNTRLQEEYGLPTWGSYGLFALGTIFVGAALGLLLVCLVDLLYPPKKSQRRSFSESKENALEDEIDNDDLEIDAQRTISLEEEEDSEDEPDTSDNESEPAESEGTGERKDNNNALDREKSNSDTEEQTIGDKDAPLKSTADKVEQVVAEAISGPASPGETRKRKPRKAD